jgi:hypothetical protein
MPANSEVAPSVLKPEVLSIPEIPNIKDVVDGDYKTEINLELNKPLVIDFNANEQAKVRSLRIKLSERKTMAMAELYAKSSDKYELIKKFELNRSKLSINVGFEPNAPIVISIPETSSKSFRLVVNNVTMAGEIAEVEFLTTPLVERFPEKSLAKMHQTPLPYWKEYMWEPQPEVTDKRLVINPDSVIDLTKLRTPDGRINWKVPSGKWKIVQYGMTTTGKINAPASPEATGLETDKMSKEHIAAHYDAFLGEIMRRIPAADRKTWKVVVQDSYETGGQNWTDGLTEEFKTKYGYSPVPFLPVLKGTVVGSRDQSDRFLWDLRRLIADKVSYDYVAGLREVSHKNGLTTWLENYGHWGFPGEFLQYGGQSDEVGGEFWSEGDLGNIENRAASSCAHIYGKVKVSAESFTCGGKAYSRHPATMKQRGDRFFTEGINNTLLHLYIQQPNDKAPGLNAGFGNEFNRHNTWFEYMPMFTQYLKRSNFMLQQGNYIADAAYFIGEDAPKMTGICDPALPQGYSFDYINGEVILNRVKVKDGKLVLPDGMSYRILVLPKQETMRPELLEKIKELVLQGATVLGPAPKYSPSMQNYPQADQQVQKLARELWGKIDGVKVKSAKVGKGMILSGMEMQEAFDFMGVVPDCKLPNDIPVLFIHRQLTDGDVYFLSNQTDKTLTIDPEFRSTGKAPELWDPVKGSIRKLPSFKQVGQSTVVPLRLEPYESQFIVFRNRAEKSKGVGIDLNFPLKQNMMTINTDWRVSFNPKQRGPVHPVEFKELHDWTLLSNDSVKYYSGTAVYKKQVTLSELPSNRNILLSLGNLTAMATVKVNNIEVGGLWTPPYEVDITSAIKKGTNDIEISVVNNWMNRLIGDLKMPEAQRPVWSPVVPYTANTPLQPSGLFGPVEIRTVVY